MTTNGVLLGRAAPRRSSDAGLHRLTVSLDTLRARALQARWRASTSSTACSRASTPRAAVFPGFKIDTVIIRGVNDDEIVDAAGVRAGARRRGALHRVHGRRRRDALDDGRRSCRAREMLERLGGALRAGRRRWARRASAPADRFRLPTGHVFGIIASTTAAVLRRLRPQPADGRRAAGICACMPRAASTCAARSAAAPAPSRCAS